VDDYITCKIPDFRALFAEIAPELANCRCRFGESPPYAAADISPVYSASAQPVIYHNRLHLEVIHADAKGLRLPFIRTGANGVERVQVRNTPSIRTAAHVNANDSQGLAQLSLHFSDGTVQSWQSNPFSSWQQNGFQIWAGYDADRYSSIYEVSKIGWPKFLEEVGFWDEIQPEYAGGFLMWESEANPNYTDEVMPAGFGLGPGTEIYIGHNPDTKTYFNGTIRAVSVDPGCRGH
jgi:hypothetical protein